MTSSLRPPAIDDMDWALLDTRVLGELEALRTVATAAAAIVEVACFVVGLIHVSPVTEIVAPPFLFSGQIL